MSDLGFGHTLISGIVSVAVTKNAAVAMASLQATEKYRILVLAIEIPP